MSVGNKMASACFSTSVASKKDVEGPEIHHRLQA